MADQSDISTLWAGILASGTFIGGVIVAILKGGKSNPEPERHEDREIQHMMDRMEKIESRQSESDIRIEVAMNLFGEVKEQSSEIKKQLNEMNMNITRALTQLEERRRK